MEIQRQSFKQVGVEPRLSQCSRKKEWDADSRILKQTPLQIVPNQSRKSLFESIDMQSADTTNASDNIFLGDKQIKSVNLPESDEENSQGQEEHDTNGVSREIEWYVQRQIHKVTTKLHEQLNKIEKSQIEIMSKLDELDNKIQNQDNQINKKTMDKLKIMYDNEQHLEQTLTYLKENMIEPINKEIANIKQQLDIQ